MFNISGFAPGQFPHKVHTIEEYFDACEKCEVKVTINTAAELNRLKPALFYDLKRSGNKGRCLDRDFIAFGLKKGDRLEVTTSLRDVAQFESLVPPCVVTFWRCSNETLTRRRNPVMSKELGITYDCLIVDMLHCLHLGVLQRYVSFVWWSLVEHNAFKVSAANDEEMLMLTVRRLRARLFAFYPIYKAENPEHSSLTELSDMPVKTLGPRGAYLLKTKAAMTRPLVPFTNRLLRELTDVIPHQKVVLAAGESLDRLLIVLRGETDIITPVAFQELSPNKLGVFFNLKPW
jgi:hypothetical protein